MHTRRSGGAFAGECRAAVLGAALLCALPAWAGAAPVPELSEQFQHASGLAIRHPSGWIAETLGDFLVLRPQSTDGLPRFLCFTEEAEGVTDPASPEVGAALLALLRQEAPAAQPGGETRTMSTPLGPAGVHRFDEPGRRHQVYVVLLPHEEALVLDFVHSGDAGDSAGDLADAMVTTLGRIEVPLERDQLLVGAWQRRTHAATDPRGGTVSGDDTITLVFEPDGTVRRSLESSISGALDGLSVIAASRSHSGWATGTWTTGRQTLTLVWSDGTTEQFSASAYRNSYTGEMNLRLSWPGASRPLILHRIEG